MLGNDFSEVINKPLLFFLSKKTEDGMVGCYQTLHRFNNLNWENALKKS